MSEPRFNAFARERKDCAANLRYTAERLVALDQLEELLPAFVARRFRFMGIAENYLSLYPAEPENADPDSLHADVYKLFDFLVKKRVDSGNSGLLAHDPTRTVNKSSGLISYRFTITGLPMSPLSVEISGIPVGSKCEIIKHVKGTKTVEDVEYELVCEEDAP